MTRFLKHLRSLAATVLTGGLALIIAGSSAQTTPTNATVDLSLGPIATSAQAVNVALALSVEFPTVGAAYRTPDYSHTTVYLGYFDATGCYAYKDTAGTAGEAPPLSGEYFYRTGNVDANGYCDNASSGAGKYSGNLLNYVTTSSIDLLRYALTGGNRVVDTAGTTILERAYLYNNWNLHNGTYFPAKRIPAALVGKVTPVMTKPSDTTPFTGDVIAGGCWDRVYFGTSSTSVGCANAETTTSGNLNAQATTTGGIQTGRVPVGTPIPSTAIGAVTTTVSWEVSNPLVTSTVAPTTGPTTDTFTYYVAIPGTTTNLAPTGSGLSNNTVSLTYTPVTVPPTTATAPVPVSTYLTEGTEPDRSIQGYTTATLAIGIIDTNAIPDTATTTSEPLVITNNSTTRGYKVCAFGTAPNPTRIGGRTQNGSVTNSGVDQSWCNANFPGSTQTTLRDALNWKSGVAASQTFNRNISRTPYYKKYTVTRNVQNWEARTGWNVYQQWQYYTYYPITSQGPAPMYARVRVCDSTEDTLRDDLCVRYPNGKYKPIGEIQRYAKGVRVAAFGYLKDDSDSAYGGVLRAPMKYPGPAYTDPKGVPQTNSQTEWDSDTGIFSVDPMGASPSYATSGVINYLNKFGTAGSVKGYYKGLDPVGELYYEALRYFQGLPPSSQAVTTYNNDAGKADGFPVYASAPTTTTTVAYPAAKGWADPLQNACERRNFILAIGDVNTHYDKQLPGHMSTTGVNSFLTQDPARAAVAIPGSAATFNAVDWTDLLTGFETGTAKAYTDAQGRAQTTAGNPNPNPNNTLLATKATGSGGHSAYYWAGAAYWANTQPIRLDQDKDGQSMKDIRVKTFTIDVDEGGNGDIEDSNTRGIKPRRSSFYLAGKYGWFNDANLDGNPFTTAGATNNTEWQDPAAPNTPDGYVIASQAQKMIDGIRKFFKTASTQRGAASVSAISSARYTADAPNGDFFAPQFNVSDWSGTVQRSKLALNTTTGTVESTNELIWDAGVILNSASIATGNVLEPMVKPADRNIITLSTDTVTKGVLFDVANKGQFDAAVLAELGKDPASGSTDTLTDARINFIRGDRSNEGPSSIGKFRQRGSPMGDVINSGPVYKQSADPGLTGAGYQAFAYSVKDRGATIYVGANDGMMHAFRADDGKELFAYIPRAVATRLNKLTNPKYLHQPYVDGVPLVGEAKVGANWKTLLVSGMGGGAQGIFALDVTDPTAFGVGNVMFEFTDADDPAMGNVLTQPTLVKLKIPPVAPATTPTYKWFIAVGSGYNNYRSDGTGKFSATGEQALFFLSVDKNPGENWQEGSNYFKILVPVASTTAANGMLNPGFVKDASGVATILYSGDLQGNMWRFDLSDGLNTSGIANAVQLSAGAKIPLFVATDAGGNRQPITTSPQVVEANAYGHMVVFGTGKFVEASDTSTTQSQAIYGIWDSLETQAARFTVPKTKLFQRTSTTVGETVKLTLGGFTYGNAAATETSSSVYRGWYLNLPTAKERIAVESVVGIGAVIFASAIPEGACSGDGSGRKYCLNPVDGSSTCGDFTTTIGIPSGPKIFQIELDDSSYTARSPTGRRTVTIEQQAISSSTKITDAGNALVSGTKLQSISIPAGRLSWRELRN